MSTHLADLARRTKSDMESLDCKFVDPFPKEVQTDCSICLNILKEPYVVGCCGYRFCKGCLQPSIRVCPLCKSYNFDKIPDKQLERLLKQRAVYCVLQKNGCNWTGELDKLSSHLDFGNSLSKTACSYLPVPCTFCEQYFKRKDLQSHQKSCDSKPFVCRYCSYKGPYKNLFQHLKECPKQPQLCKHKCSDKRFTKEDMEAHLANDCPLETITCEYRFVGCGMSFLRKDLEEHMEERVKVHLRQVTARCKQFQEKEQNKSSAVQKLTDENKRLTKELAEMTLLAKRLIDENETLRWSKQKREILNLVVKNLPPGVTEHNLKCVFGQFGTVENIVLKKSRNHAIVTYSEQSEFEEALDASSTRGINLLKHKLSVQAYKKLF